jgi:ribosomal protein S18 acetylase RimI-like enzyme
MTARLTRETGPAPAREAGPALLRRAEPDDLDRLVALWTAVADHHARFDAHYRLRDGANHEVRELLRAVLRDPDAAVWLADPAAADGPAGFCIARVDQAPPILHETRRAEITDLFVRPAARRRGVGRALVAAARAFALGRGVRRIEARVAHANAEGQAFWRALGFADFVDVLDLRL